jgi:hypothetical protein
MKKILFFALLLILPTGQNASAYSDSAGFNPLPVMVEAQGAGFPVGTIIVWPVSSNPDDAENWLDCNGQSTSGYPELAAIVGPTVPNYQGMFLRGYGSQAHTQLNGSEIGYTSTTHSSGALGAVQGDATRNVTGTIEGIASTMDVSGLWASGSFETITTGVRDYVDGGNYSGGFNGFSQNFSNTIPTADEIRPVNIAVRSLVSQRLSKKFI